MESQLSQMTRDLASLESKLNQITRGSPVTVPVPVTVPASFESKPFPPGSTTAAAIASITTVSTVVIAIIG